MTIASVVIVFSLILLAISLVALTVTRARAKLWWVYLIAIVLLSTLLCGLAGFGVGVAITDGITCDGWLCSLGILIQIVFGAIVLGFVVSLGLVIRFAQGIRRVVSLQLWPWVVTLVYASLLLVGVLLLYRLYS